MNLSTITLTTAAGTQTFKVGNQTAIVIERPVREDLRTATTFEGFAQRHANGVNDGDGIDLPRSRISALALRTAVGTGLTPDVIDVTLAGGTGGGAWSDVQTIPVRLADTIVRTGVGVQASVEVSTLTLVDAIAAENMAGSSYTKTISLEGLSAISVTEAT